MVNLVLDDWKIEEIQPAPAQVIPELIPELIPEPQLKPEEAESKFTNVEANDEPVPENATLMGQGSATASSDTLAEAGESAQAALSGEQDVKVDIKIDNSSFSSGPAVGVGEEEAVLTQQEIREARELQEAQEAQEAQEEVLAPAEEKEEFVELESATKVVEEQLPDPKLKAKPKVEEAKLVEEVIPQEKIAPAGGFKTEAKKTRVHGVMSANGKGSLDVANTALGRYEAQLFKLIETKWQQQNYQFRSHLAPGTISIRFIVDAKGRVSGQRRVDMQGASQIQWGLVIQSVNGAEIPKMPKDVLQELDGEPLELIVTFNY